MVWGFPLRLKGMKLDFEAPAGQQHRADLAARLHQRCRGTAPAAPVS